LRLGAFAGVVYIKQQIVVGKTLKTDRALKPIFGIEVPLSALVSKLGGGGKSQNSKGGGGGKSGGP